MVKKQIRDVIFDSNDISREMVTVPEWGDVTFELRSPSLRQRMRLIDLGGVDGKVNTTTLYPWLLVICAFDPDTNEPVFTPEDVEALTERSGEVIERLGDIAMRVSGIATVPDGGKADSPQTSNGGTPSV